MPTQNIYDLVDTWNASGTTFSAIKMNVTDTASASGSLLMDLQLGGVSQFRVAKTVTNVTDTSGSHVFASMFQTQRALLWGSATGGGLKLNPSTVISWQSGSDISRDGAVDVTIRRRAAANLQLGAADTASPVAQTLGVQSVTGVADTAGANFTIAGSQGTGSGAGGSIVFQVAPAGSSGTAQNALATALTIGGDRRLSFPDGTFIINNAPTGASNQIGIWAGGVFGLNRGGGNASQIVLYANGVSGLLLNGGTSGGAAPYLSFASPTAGTHDTFITRDAANTLALRNGANAQAFRVYNTTDGTNSEYASLTYVGNVARWQSEKSGTGTVRNMEIIRGTTSHWSFNTSGNIFGAHLLAGTDNTYDIGASGATRPRDLFLGRNLVQVGAYHEMAEMTAPSAPAADGVRIYAVDNGSGKTQLMALFATGAAQQIAIEP